MRPARDAPKYVARRPFQISRMPALAHVALAIPRRDAMIQPRSQRAAAVRDRGPEIFDATLEKT